MKPPRINLNDAMRAALKESVWASVLNAPTMQFWGSMEDLSDAADAAAGAMHGFPYGDGPTPEEEAKARFDAIRARAVDAIEIK